MTPNQSGHKYLLKRSTSSLKYIQTSLNPQTNPETDIYRKQCSNTILSQEEAPANMACLNFSGAQSGSVVSGL